MRRCSDDLLTVHFPVSFPFRRGLLSTSTIVVNHVFLCRISRHGGWSVLLRVTPYLQVSPRLPFRFDAFKLLSFTLSPPAPGRPTGEAAPVHWVPSPANSWLCWSKNLNPKQLLGFSKHSSITKSLFYYKCRSHSNTVHVDPYTRVQCTTGVSWQASLLTAAPLFPSLSEVSFWSIGWVLLTKWS